MVDHRTEDRGVGRDERNGADRCWIWRNAFHEPCVTFTKPDPKMHPSVEYVRVMSRQEVEKLANDFEGVNVQQYINSLQRTIEGQRRHIRELQSRIPKEEEPPSFSPNFDERNGLR